MSNMSNSKLRKIDGTLLLVFSEAYRLRKLTTVARQLGMTQSAVSHALGRLREIFEDELFLRRPLGVEPTQRARELAPRVDAMLHLTREALANAETFDPASSTREFRMTGLDSATVLLGSRLIALCRRAAPNVRLSFRSLARKEALRAVADGDVDVAVCMVWTQSADLRIEPLYRESYRVAARRNHPRIGRTLDLKTYLALDHVLVSVTGDPVGIVDRTLAAKGHARRVVATLPMFLPALAAVAQSDVIVTMPAQLVDTYKKPFGLRAYDPPLPIRPFTLSAVWHRRNDADPGLRWFMTQLRACAQ
jgi:DNA-binding transcriptional LysR family regulator